MRTIAILALVGTLATATIAADKISFATDDTPVSVLTRQIGQKVELHLRSGEKITGTLKAVGAGCVHVASLSGQEFYDAVVTTNDISAVVLRNDGK